MSTVSTIVINDNQAKFVVQAVESVLAQTFGDVEIIVVDRGGTGDASEALSVYQDQITYIRQPGQGLRSARAAGLQASAGTYLLFMRADDLLPPRKVELQIKHLAARPELGLAYFGGQIQIGEATQIIREVEPNQPDAEVAMEFLLSGCPLIRRECLERAGLLETPSIADADWNPWQQISLADYEIDPQERLILSKEHLTLFLRKLHRGDTSTAQRHMIEAVRLSPSTLKEPEVFINSVFDYAKEPDASDAVAFAQTALDHLPDCARELERFRPRILGELSIARAFRSYRIGQMAQVRRDIVAGLSYDPSLLKNKGIILTFCRSLLNQSGLGKREPGIPQSVIAGIQEALGKPVDGIEHTVDGTCRNTYLVRSSGRPFILRVAKEQAHAMALSQVMAVIERVRTIGVPVPLILAYNCPAPDIPEPAWTIEKWMPGRSFIPQNMRWRDALSAATDLGQCLRRLHSIETKGFGILSSTHLDAPYQTFGQWVDSQILDNRWALALLPLEALPPIEAACQFLHEPYKEAPKLCHGDLVPSNLLVNTGRLSAVIDWDKACGCDPAFDIASLHFWINDEQILTALLQAYAPDAPEMFRRRVKAGVICYTVALLAWDFSNDRRALDADKRRCLEWLTDNRVLSSFR